MEKGKMSKDQKSLWVALVAIIVFNVVIGMFLTGCNSPTVKGKKTEYRLEGYDKSLMLVEIDGCEYLYGPWGNGTVLTHKGNCKNHFER